MARLLLSPLLLLCISIFSTYALSHPLNNQHQQQEKLLLQFKDAISHSNATFLPDWTPNRHHLCNWSGLTCDPSFQSVLSLNLSHMNLDGTISPVLGNLSTLQYLDLSWNALTGEGGVECEKLPVEMCAFSVSSSGFRCVLEKKYSFVPSTQTSSVEYQCQSSDIMAEMMMEWIESEECLQSCGLQRMSVGMSTDGLSEHSDFTSKLCSDKCQNSCPNIVNLYLNLAAGEGIYLPHLCEAHKTRSRRMMIESVAAGPTVESFSLVGVAPAPY